MPSKICPGSPDLRELKLISVIIPTLNEESCIENCINSVGLRHGIEILVVDGGSNDCTVQIVERLGCKILVERPNRAAQMNLGAKKASGDVFLFLHADTALPEHWPQEVFQVFEKSDVVCGAFSLSIFGNSVGLRFVEKLANFRSRIFQLPYGDQALFLRKKTYEEIAGFPEYLIMEDFEFVNRLKKLGKIYISRLSVKTSDRRWKKLGVLWTTLVNQIMIIGYWLGFSDKNLRKIYDFWLDK